MCLKVALDVVSCVGEERRLGLCRALLHQPRHPSQPLLRYHCAHHSLRTPPSSARSSPECASCFSHARSLLAVYRDPGCRGPGDTSQDYMRSGCVEGNSSRMEYARVLHRGKGDALLYRLSVVTGSHSWCSLGAARSGALLLTREALLEAQYA